MVHTKRYVRRMMVVFMIIARTHTAPRKQKTLTFISLTLKIPTACTCEYAPFCTHLSRRRQTSTFVLFTFYILLLSWCLMIFVDTFAVSFDSTGKESSRPTCTHRIRCECVKVNKIPNERKKREQQRRRAKKWHNDVQINSNENCLNAVHDLSL